MGMTQMRTTPKATPLVVGMMIWADRFGFSRDRSPSRVTAVRPVTGGVMVTINGEEINLTSRTPYLLHA